MRAKIIWPHLCRLTSAARFPALKTKQPFLCGVTHHAVIRAEQLYFLGNSMLNAYICTFLLTSFSADGINMCIYFACDYLPPPSPALPLRCVPEQAVCHGADSRAGSLTSKHHWSANWGGGDMLQCLFFSAEGTCYNIASTACTSPCMCISRSLLPHSSLQKISSFQFSTSPIVRIYPIAAKNVRLTKT